ncbi:LOW QUALITY PROTEIN: hypothetical protein CRUP_010270 [Coryphaenoides rupestris]|nr:LOW QUALITY PROTEIN: hypothetical protein CRUP_010270 [Coryphaenoides rupestris]
MSRWLFPWSGSIKKRACRYLLQHYLGHFLQERLSLDQLGLDLYNGSGVIKEIHLDVWAVNELLESLGAPLEIVDGFVSSIAVTIPWQALVTDHCTLEVTGLQITCRPKYRTSASWDSQGWSSSMTSSMQLAQEFLRRIKVTFVDTIVRIEHQPLDLETGVALEVHIKRLEYCDEAVREPASSQNAVPVDIHQPPAFLHKILQLSAVQLFYESTGTHQALLLLVKKKKKKKKKRRRKMRGKKKERNRPPPPPLPLLIGSCSGFIETMVKIKQNDMLPGPKLELDGKVGSLHLLLSPDQIIHLTDLMAALCIDTEPESKGTGVHSQPLDPEDLRLIEEDLGKQLDSSPRDREWDEELDMDPYLYGMENGEMFYSMGPGGAMSISVTSARSGSELSDSDMESSTLSLSSLSQPAQGNYPRRYPVAGSLSSLSQANTRPRGRSHSGQSEALKPDALLRLSLGGLTLTLLQEDPPTEADGAPSLAQVFFRELAFFKDSMLTGAAVQVACETRSGGRHSRSVTSDLSFSRLELLECLWGDGGPQYCQGRQRVVRRDSVVKVELAELSAELDLDVLSRLGNLSRAFSHCPTQTPQPASTQTLSSELYSSFSLASPHAVLRLRFPVPDLRPPPARRPPNQKAVRQETLVLQLSELELRHQEAPDLQGEQQQQRTQPQGQCRAEAPCLTQLLEASFSDLQGSYEGWEGDSFPCIRVKKNGDSLPRIWVRVSGGDAPSGSGPGAGLASLARDLATMSFESPCEIRDKTSSPFSSNRTMFETEEMVIPADPEEMRQFQAHCVAHCQCAMDISLPLAYILLPSKQAFQSIYNRINNDLLMWEPPPPPPPSSDTHHPSSAHLNHRHQDDEFQLCKSAFRLDSDSEEEEPHYAANNSAERRALEPHPNHNLSLLSLTVVIGKGRLQARTDKKDHNHGELVLDLEGGKIFSVAQHQNNPNLNFLCVESRRVDLYHRPVVEDSPIPDRLEMPNFTAPKHLDPTIYQTEVGEFLVAVRLQGATMRHYVAQSGHSWHEQLVEFLDVIDDPILGPLYLPLRIIFTAESFSLSSNIITQPPSTSDYVCVLDIDLLELAITTWKGSEASKLTQPLFELRCSNNVVHMHTCADSCAALVNLLQYLLSESPACPPPCHPAETAEINQYDLADALIDTERNQREEGPESGSPAVPRGDPVSVYLFPGEAPKHRPSFLPVDGDEEEEEEEEGEEEEDPDMELDRLVATATEAQADMLSQEGSEGSTDNDDFCILEAPGMGIPPRDGEPVVTVLAPGPIMVKDGHFSRPRGSADLLRAPSRFPVPENRVVLREGPAVGPCAGGEQPLSRQVFIVQELEVRDRLASSQLNKFLYLYTSESMPRRAHSNMLTVKALQVRPESGLGGPECCLRVSLLPLRLNIDQDALFFLKDFFSNLASLVNPYLPVDPAAEVKADSGQKPDEEAESGAGLGPDLAASVETTYSEQSSSSAGSTSSSDQPIYFREFRFTSEVPIWLDYHGKHVVIEQGTFAGILIGLAQLNCSELKLKQLCCRHGLLGVDKVIQYAVSEWLTDIRKNQLPGILGGVGPMHSVVQLFHGVRDLFWMPIEQYRKDGRIIRGLQRGAASFGTSTASAALELSNRLVQAIQATAETVYDILSPTPPLTRYTITEGRPRPRAAPEGVAKAYDTVRETLCDVASRGHEQKGLPGAVGGILRQIPPHRVASEATSNLLGGMRNQIKPDARKEDFFKWRTEDGQE